MAEWIIDASAEAKERAKVLSRRHQLAIQGMSVQKAFKKEIMLHPWDLNYAKLETEVKFEKNIWFIYT